MKTLKSKIITGLLFLLLLIILLSLTGLLSIYYLSSDSREIIKDNYKSLEYCINMRNSLERVYGELVQYNDLKANKSLETEKRINLNEELSLFESYFKSQKNNVTERGEDLLVNNIEQNYNQFKANIYLLVKDPTDSIKIVKELLVIYSNLTEAIKSVYELNTTAIIRKNDIANETASKVTLIMISGGLISLALTTLFIIYFPSYITKPIAELKDKILEISNKKYDQKIELKSNDEFKKLADAFNAMTGKLKEYENQHLDELILEKRRIETLVANLADGIMMLGDDFRILMVNRVFREITNLNLEALIDKKINDTEIENEIIQSIKKIILNKNLMKDGSRAKVKIELNGNTEYYQILLLEIPIRKTSKNLTEVSGYIVIVQNITRYEERDLARTNMLATISHELKTPLSSINLSLKLLEDNRIGALNEEQKGIINTIKVHTNRILKLVNEVLDYTQLETGHIKLRIEKCSVNDIIELGTFAVLMKINEKEINLEINIEDGISNVKCDLEKTVWVMVNLLSNAVRFSKKKSRIKIEAKTGNGFVHIEVIDNGPGINEDEQERIFEKYVTGNQKNLRGTGLGLAIAREFVEVQGGKIGLKSKIGKGSTFYFTLPKI